MALFNQGQGPLTNALQSFLGAKQQAATQRLMGPAMSGDPEAVSQLMGVNPQLGMQVQNQLAAQQAQQQQMAQAEAAALARAQEMALKQKRFGLDERELAMKEAEQKRKAEDPLKLGKGERLVDRNTFEVLSAPAAEDDTEAQNLKFEQATKLRKELSGLSKSFQTQDDAYGRVISSAENPSAAGDLALIFNYMKVLDPGSTVREGEFANAENSAGVDQRVRGLYNKIMEGKRLTETQRLDFVDRSRKLYGDAAEKQLKREGRYKGLAEKRGLDTAEVVSSLVNYRDDKFQAVQEAAEAPAFDIGTASTEDLEARRQQLLAEQNGN